ncbi:NAD(P)-dependent oxidoreductase [Photorhabdus temperata]|uniref:Beta-hydroxyacid dehydrogenase, 3-hydroxyisobutyrate dehydrogenase n=1 Tax=Photorhabdus temperata subsp. temperata Meg1 TaxID=1393735 RepID=A0A081S104_PHOTE|nr:NAD(P)-dependent oxidoreductase [Photorhabdus temperata]KER04607.1 beta-hydroxyacid dehydrogenase, 3-hydroxyisobutyrate dehydrogenase [Photorhabdus temperata subsp. temperata Meg1]
MNNIGFIGLGRLGKAICSKLLEKNIELYIHNRSSNKATELIQHGAIWCENISELAKNCRVIFICTAGETAIEKYLMNEVTGLIAFLEKGSIIIDLSTISPAKAIQIHNKLSCHSLSYIECPVSGGSEGALNGSLSAIVAGDEAVWDMMQPLLYCFCKEITYTNKLGEAQQLKILNNIAESINLAGALEVIKLGLLQEIDIELMQKVFTSCRGCSAYMNVALKYIISGEKTSDVSLAIRCKDLHLAESLYQNFNAFQMIDKVKSLFLYTKEIYGEESDQCDYFSLISKRLSETI